jgi:DNA polymerase kappa
MEEERISKGDQPIIKGYESPDVDESLKYQLLGPSLIKAGQDSVDQRKVREKGFSFCCS